MIKFLVSYRIKKYVMSTMVRFAAVEIYVTCNLRLLVNQLAAWGMHKMRKALLNFALASKLQQATWRMHRKEKACLNFELRACQ